MDLTQILAQTRKVIDAGQSIAGPLAAMGVPYAGVVRATLEVAENLQQRIADGAVVATSDQHDVVKRMIEELQEENDRLAAEIDAS